MKRTYTVGGVEFIQDEEQLRFRLSWPALLMQIVPYLLLIPFLGYVLALPWLEPHRPGGSHIEPGVLGLGLFIESVLLIFLLGRISDRVRAYTLDLRDRTLRQGALRLCSLDDVLTVGVVQRTRAYRLEFTLRPDSRTVQALRLSTLKGASAAVKEIAQFLGMDA